MPNPDEKSRENFGFTPERFREDYDPDPWIDPKSGVEYPINPRDVLDPEEYNDWRRERRRR